MKSDVKPYLSPEEAVAEPALVDQWRELDGNQDGYLDASEFARFEVQP